MFNVQYCDSMNDCLFCSVFLVKQEGRLTLKWSRLLYNGSCSEPSRLCNGMKLKCVSLSRVEGAPNFSIHTTHSLHTP